MGAVLSTHGPVHLSVMVNSKGSKVVKSKFTSKAPLPGVTVEEYHRTQVMPMINPKDVGGLIQVCVIPRGASHEIEVENLDDLASMYADMGLVKVIFYHEQPDIMEGIPKSNDIASVLVREANLKMPMWSHSGRPALTQIYAELRRLMEKDGLGFKGAFDLKMGQQWLQDLTHLLYALSPFHTKLKLRRCAMPDVFAFSHGANDFKKKGKSEPNLTQELLREVSGAR